MGCPRTTRTRCPPAIVRHPICPSSGAPGATTAEDTASTTSRSHRSIPWTPPRTVHPGIRVGGNAIRQRRDRPGDSDMSGDGPSVCSMHMDTRTACELCERSCGACGSATRRGSAAGRHLRLVHVLLVHARGVQHRLRRALRLGLRDAARVLVQPLALALTATPAVRRTHVGARGTAIGDRAAGAIACREASVVACVVVAALIFSSKALQPP